MKLGGLQETSLLDYPGKICAIVWTVGCNFRCPFCYNQNMVFSNTELLPEENVFSFLDTRKGKLDALSITGGEPLLHEDIGDFAREVKKRGFLVKVDTNGTFPDRLEQLLTDNLIDYVSMDVKAPKDKYDVLTGVETSVEDIDRSISIIKDMAPDYEFKTTVVPSFLEKEDLITIAEEWLQDAKRYYVQQFKKDAPLISKELEDITPYPQEYLYEIVEEVKPYFEQCDVRGI